MKLELVRDTYTEESTTGKLYIDDVFFCYVLEDKVRGLDEKKIWGRTAIPAGTYKLSKRYSPNFKTNTPYLNNVPGYEFVLIHWGNTHLDTNGCLLVGYKRGANMVWESRKAFNALYDKFDKALARKEKVYIEVVDTFE